MPCPLARYFLCHGPKDGASIRARIYPTHLDTSKYKNTLLNPSCLLRLCGNFNTSSHSPLALNGSGFWHWHSWLRLWQRLKPSYRVASMHRLTLIDLDLAKMGGLFFRIYLCCGCKFALLAGDFCLRDRDSWGFLNSHI